MSNTLVLKSTGDARVDSTQPNAALGKTSNTLTVHQDEKLVFIFFPIGTIISGSQVETAVLSIHLKGSWPGTNTIFVRRVTSSWTESKVTWNNKPSTTSTHAGSAIVVDGVADSQVDIDITSLVQDVADGDTYNGVRLAIDVASDRKVRSEEAADSTLHSFMTIVYSFGPSAPTKLRPDGDASVDSSRPLLAWDYSSPIGSTQGSSQVQVSSSTDFSVPDYDSGMVANTVQEWDLALATSPSFSALPDGAVRYWRVRVEDQSGAESDWSDTATFTRTTYGSLSITNPAVDGDTVEETTPPIIHLFTTRTQVQTEHILYKLAATDADWVKIYDTLMETTTDTSWTIPAGLLVDPTAQYMVTVRVWDDSNRDAPGETAYTERSRIFVFEATSVATPPSNLSGITAGAYVLLSWQRATAPDFFAVYEDDLLLEDRLDPADVLVSGTTYQFKVWTARPGVAHTYRVEAIVDDGGVSKHSQGNPEVTMTFSPIGVYLSAPDDNLVVRLLDQQSATSDIGESGNTFTPVGSRRPVRISDGVRGYEGSVSGLIAADDTATAAVYLVNLEAIKSMPPGSYIRLVFGSRNIPVDLGQTSAAQVPLPEEAYNVSIEYWQVDEFTVGV